MLAIIPARGGSKGLPRKNVLDLGGVPLIAHTIIAAKEALSIDRVIVSTDDDEIMSIAKALGVEIPFRRPSKLSGDTSRAMDVYNHAIEELELTCSKITEFCILLPTSPLRSAKHIDEAYSLFVNRKADSVISVSDYEHPVEWALESGLDKRLVPLFNGHQNKNRQELRTIMRPNGAIYIFKRDFWDLDQGYYSQKTYGYYMSPEFSIDIDTALDLEVAKILFLTKQAFT